MFDDSMRRVNERVNQVLLPYVSWIHPVLLSLIGVGVGAAAALLLWQGEYLWGVVGWTTNRFLDGLDGAVARATGKQTDVGGYIDVIADFAVYAIVPIGLVAGMPSDAGWLALAALLSSFYLNAGSWIYLAALLEKRGRGAAQDDASTSITIPGGIVGGFATAVFYGLFILFPTAYIPIFWSMSTLVIIGVVQRLIWAVRRL